MVKDYKQVPAVDYEVEAIGDPAAGYPDLAESSGDEANDGDDHGDKKTSEAFDFDESIPTGELNSWK